jgi:predicted ArsR family transcriptional regulator
MHDILQYLKHHGEQLDSQIAAAIGISLAKVRSNLSELATRGDVVVCRSIRYQEGKQIDALLCRLSGFTPPATPGRKAKAQ